MPTWVATVADFAARQKRAVYRPVELGRERLEARVRRLPRSEQLLQSSTQKLDELSDRLRRGLIDRAGAGRERLAGASARLASPILERAVRDAGQRLAGVRLEPALVERPLLQKREQLLSLARLASQFHPESRWSVAMPLCATPMEKRSPARRKQKKRPRLSYNSRMMCSVLFRNPILMI